MKLINLVNTKQGSASVHRFSNGNTLPLVQRPFGMTAFCPQTAEDNERWFYHPDNRSFEGLRITHQPSPWIGDYGTVIFMPQSGKPAFGGEERWSGFRPEDAVMTPAYYSVYLLRYKTKLEVTPGVRGGMLRVTFGKEKDNFLSVLPLSGWSEFEYKPEENTLYAIVTNNRGHAKNFKMYVTVKFEEGAIDAEKSFCVTESAECKSLSISGENCGIHLACNCNIINAKIATSYISYEQAFVNMGFDFLHKDFENVKNEAETIWEDYLSRVAIETDDEDQLRTFVSCMYRAFLYPHACYEIDDRGRAIHYQPADGETHFGVRYTDNGFWDTYRTCYPFYALVAKSEYASMCEGFVNDYLEGGWLPRWPSIAERGCMPSTLIDAVLCDAVVKGIVDDRLAHKALEGMIHHANEPASDGDFGRNGVVEYNKLGYVPIEAHIESVNLTLDAAYGDWCIARIAEKLGEMEIVKEYDKRADNYKNLFDSNVGFMRARHGDGSWREDFNPFYWGGDYTEGSAWQNSFAVPHDIKGLTELYGGKEQFEAKVDELFATAPDYIVKGYNCEIHEMTEMAAVDFGQCAISNQPSFHLPYLYSEIGEADKTSAIVEKMCKEVFSWKNDGFPGDEDNGSMALWYVFGTIGIYPFCPGKNEYCRTKKLAKSVKILGKEFDADKFTASKILFEEVPHQ